MSTKVLSNQRVTVIAGLASGISNWKNPSLSELAALTNVSGAVNWNAFDLNIKASDQKDDRTLTDGAGAQSRGFTNFGGNLQFVTPLVTDTASIYRTTYNIFSTPRVELVVAVRYGKLNSMAPAAGDRWYIYHVITDVVAFGQNDVSKFYQVSLVPRDDVLANYIVPAAVPALVAVTPLAAAGTVGKVVFISAAYQGWDVTVSATWASSDESKVLQVHPGIFLCKSSGSAGITAIYPGGTISAPTTITVS